MRKFRSVIFQLQAYTFFFNASLLKIHIAYTCALINKTHAFTNTRWETLSQICARNYDIDCGPVIGKMGKEKCLKSACRIVGVSVYRNSTPVTVGVLLTLRLNKNPVENKKLMLK